MLYGILSLPSCKSAFLLPVHKPTSWCSALLDYWARLGLLGRSWPNFHGTNSPWISIQISCLSKLKIRQALPSDLLFSLVFLPLWTGPLWIYWIFFLGLPGTFGWSNPLSISLEKVLFHLEHLGINPLRRVYIYDPGSRFATTPPPWYGPKTCVLQHSAWKRGICSVFWMVGCWRGLQTCKFAGFLQPSFRKRVICNVFGFDIVE